MELCAATFCVFFFSTNNGREWLGDMAIKWTIISALQKTGNSMQQIKSNETGKKLRETFPKKKTKKNYNNIIEADCT